MEGPLAVLLIGGGILAAWGAFADTNIFDQIIAVMTGKKVTASISKTGTVYPVVDATTGGGALISAGSGIAAAAAAKAQSQIGVKYLWAGASPSTGFDCSGLTMWAYGQVGVTLGHNTIIQQQQCTNVGTNDLSGAQVGDLVFFPATLPSHVGIYVGNGQMVDAPHTGAFVRLDAVQGFESSFAVGRVRAAQVSGPGPASSPNSPAQAFS